MSRRAVLLGTAVAALASPAFAADPYYPKVVAGSPLYQPASIITANVDVFGGLAFGSGSSASGTVGSAGGIARVNMALHDTWNLQVDVVGLEMTSFEFLDKNTVNMDHSDVGLAAYLYKREAGWAWGPYVAFNKRGSSSDEKSAVIGLGIGPQFGPWEVHGYGYVGYLTNGTQTGTTFGAQAGAQYWIDRNTAIGGDIMYNNFNMGGANKNIWTGALTGLYRFSHVPIAALGTVRVDQYSGTSNATLWTFLLGARFYVNPSAPDALSDTESGPAFQTRLSLPPNI